MWLSYMRSRREFRKLKLLRGFKFQKGAYETPDPKWICGRSGKACRVGPSKRGTCQATFECMPTSSGGTWSCRRPASNGGTCQEGPLADGTCCNPIRACAPVRAVRAKREIISKWAAIFVVGCATLALTYAGSAQLLMPGPMTTAHSPLSKCGECHSNIGEGQFGWLHGVIASANPRKDSEACLTCHKMGPAALNPHGFESDKLNISTNRLKSVAESTPMPAVGRVINAIFPVEDNLEDGVFCATCHQEHQGKQFDLKAMANDKCQTCHTVQFDSFHNGHPKFRNYPFRRRTRIFFDHASHFGEHIPKTLEKNKIAKSEIPGVCADCHQVGVDKRHMDVKPFTEICSSCHLGQIVGAERATGPKGIALLTLPGLDIETLRKRKAEIGEWPEQSEAEITPLMKLLIGWDDERKAMLNRLSEVDLLDLSGASDGDISAVEQFVWEVKFVMYALSTARASQILKRLGSATGAHVEPNVIAKLTANMPRDVLINAQREWLPNLMSEIEKRGPGQWDTSIASSKSGDTSLSSFRSRGSPVRPVVKREIERPRSKPKAKSTGGDKSAALPRGAPEKPAAAKKEPDVKKPAPPTAGAGVATRAPKNAGKKPVQIDPDQSDTLLEDAEEILREEKKRRGKQSRIQIKHRITVAQASGGLRINELGEIVGDTPGGGSAEGLSRNDAESPANADTQADKKTPDRSDSPPTAEADGPAKKQSTRALTPKPSTKRAAPANATPSVAATARVAGAIDAETWAEFGGWYRQDFAILYKPTGHKDDFMRAWLDFSGRLVGKDKSNLASPVFDLLTADDAQGQCTKCHSVDGGSGESRAINWKPSSISTRASRFTSFAHEPHFGLLGEKGCLTCHDINDAKGHKDTYKGHDPKIFVSNFKPVEQTQCASCHGNNVAREDCLLCHIYHVSDITTPIMDTKLPK